MGLLTKLPELEEIEFISTMADKSWDYSGLLGIKGLKKLTVQLHPDVYNGKRTKKGSAYFDKFCADMRAKGVKVVGFAAGVPDNKVSCD